MVLERIEYFDVISHKKRIKSGCLTKMKRIKFEKRKGKFIEENTG